MRELLRDEGASLMDVGSQGRGRARVWLFGAAELDEGRFELRVDGVVRPLESKPLLVLRALLDAGGDVRSKDELLEAAWSPIIVSEASVTVAIGKLRLALDDRDHKVIVSVPRAGYRIGVEVRLASAEDGFRQVLNLAKGDTVPDRPQWRLEQRLGEGVWFVRHSKTGEARVFKFASTLDRLAGLRREAALSRLLHASLGERHEFARVLEWNFDAPPFSIESVFGGVSLAAWATAQGGLRAIPLDQRIALVAELARIVALAHSVGVLHLDIKPANVLIDGDQPRLRLVDFGAGTVTQAARAAAAGISGLESGETGGAAQGTAGYMAPELFDRSAPATTASDVYSLGVLLHQVVIGSFGRFPSPDWAREIEDPLLRADIEAAATGSPERRLISAADLAERLETLEARRRATAATAAAEIERFDLERRLERARLRRPWLALASLSLIVGMLGTTISAQRARREAASVLAENSFLADDLLARGDPARSGRPDETLVDAASHAEALVDKRFAAAPMVAARIHAALAAAFDSRSAWAPARDAYDRAIADYERAEGPASPHATLLLLERIPLETRSYEPGALGRAHTFLVEAEARVGRTGRLAMEARVWLDVDRGLEAEAQGRFAEAITLLNGAADSAEASPALFTPIQRFRFREREAHALMRATRFAECLAILDKLQPREALLLGPVHPETLLAVKVRVSALSQSGRSREALDLIDRFYPAFEAVLGATNRDTMMILADRGALERVLGRYDDAVRDGLLLHQRIVDMQGARAFYAFASLSDVALAQCRRGHATAGVTTAQDAWRGVRAIGGATSPWTQLLAETVAFCLIADHRPTEAVPFLDRVDPHTLAAILSDPVAAQEPALMRADVAFVSGDLVHARAFLAGPRAAYVGPTFDPYYARWTERLAKAIADAAAQPRADSRVTQAP